MEEVDWEDIADSHDAWHEAIMEDTKIFLFDVDGTLTPPRQRLAKDFEKFLIPWIKNKEVFLVSGSDFEKLKEQLPPDILQNVSGVFSCMGNAYHVRSEMKYENNFNAPEQLINMLNQHWQTETQYPHKFGNHLESRVGMLNYSTVGRAAPFHERRAYSHWDSQLREREYLAIKINDQFEGIEATVGGEISIDIYPTGWDKSQVVKHLPEGTYVFFGDKVHNGGNDYALATALADHRSKVHSVSSYHDTWNILKEQYLYD